jgi:hypothetical protein
MAYGFVSRQQGARDVRRLTWWVCVTRNERVTGRCGRPLDPGVEGEQDAHRRAPVRVCRTRSLRAPAARVLRGWWGGVRALTVCACKLCTPACTPPRLRTTLPAK